MAFISVQDLRRRLTALENQWVDTGMDREFGTFEDQGCYILTSSGIAPVAKVEMHPEFGLVIFPEDR